MDLHPITTSRGRSILHNYSRLFSIFSLEPYIFVTASFFSHTILAFLVLDYGASLWCIISLIKQGTWEYLDSDSDSKMYGQWGFSRALISPWETDEVQSSKLSAQWIQALLCLTTQGLWYLLLWIPFVLIITINDWFGYLNASFRETSLLCHCYKLLPRLCFT